MKKYPTNCWLTLYVSIISGFSYIIFMGVVGKTKKRTEAVMKALSELRALAEDKPEPENCAEKLPSLEEELSLEDCELD